jgi:prepilin-type N-terminal cleavage/methylation domain-containing protein
VAIRSPKYNSQGFTLIEMLVTIMVAGIIMGLGTHSFLSLNKPLRYGSLQFKSHLSLIRSKAISSNKAYRLKPKYSTAAEYTGQAYQQTPHNFIVEYAANCQVTAVGGTAGWAIASQLDLDLPEEVGVATTVPSAIPNIVTVNSVAPSTSLNWKVCYDNRGVAAEAVSVVLADFQGNNKAKYALVDVIGVGNIDITTKNSDGNNLPLNGDNPDF